MGSILPSSIMPISLVDVIEHVALAHPDSDALLKGGAKRHHVEEAAIDAR